MITSSKPVRFLAAAAVAVTMAYVGQPAPVQATTAAISAPEIPDTPAGRQLRWLLDAVARPPIPESELKEHFSVDFLQSVPADQLSRTLTAFKGLRLRELTKSENTLLIATVEAAGALFDLSLTTDGAGLVNGLLFRPRIAPAPKDWAELDQRLSKIAPQAGFIAAEVTKNGTCRPVHSVAPATARPLGSMFKLYVLGAVAERIASGAFGWDTRLTITPELKSVGSGELQNRPDNSKVSVLEAAKLMISISDNTAADLLIRKAGRRNVERTAWAWGARDKRDTPFLTTREMFVLKGADYPRHTKKYLSLGTAGQRAYLGRVVAKVPLSRIAGWTAPRELDTLEWYASPAQVCQAFARLSKLPDKHVGEALSINDAGLALDKAQWPSVWFKGGSEPGVHDLGHLARTAEGRSFVVTTLATNPKAPFDAAQTGSEQLGLARGAFTLVKGS
ncbi:serine hydrolase [Nonomuraea guangzhouensis]|uniref:Serine hydrolase n=1 Tax=Nonomuraea guangzhouensis TaxID=1291555 RepID=A0ABW4GRA4_9ACTN|nr:serine hydrolase [Nonomuraea guangzhouensis]